MPYKNKEDQIAYEKAYYKKNKNVIKKRSYESKLKAIKRNKEYVNDYLKKNQCIDCGNNDVRVLEFDHVHGIKFKNISDMICEAYSIKKIQEEIDKCEIRCANCHRIVTYERRDTTQRACSTVG